MLIKELVWPSDESWGSSKFTWTHSLWHMCEVVLSVPSHCIVLFFSNSQDSRNGQHKLERWSHIWMTCKFTIMYIHIYSSCWDSIWTLWFFGMFLAFDLWKQHNMGVFLSWSCNFLPSKIELEYWEGSWFGCFREGLVPKYGNAHPESTSAIHWL